MLRLTFLRASNGKALAKRFGESDSSNYPLVKNVNSSTVDIELDESWPSQAKAALEENAEIGAALLKGEVDTPLVNQSRKGKTRKELSNRLFVVDVDGVQIPGFELENMPNKIREEYLEEAAEAILDRFPAPFRGVSYVAHASASMGMKPGINLHLFMVFNKPVPPKRHKEILTMLNFYSEEITGQINLLRSGLAISFPIDRTMADNSRLVYIAPPKFDAGVRNPVHGRFTGQVRANQEIDTVEVNRWLKHTEGTANQRVRMKIAELRALKGLPPKSQQNISITTQTGRVEKVAINPDKMLLTKTSEDETFIRFNANGGDSNAYWVYKDDPRVVYNFKGEPPFLFEQADVAGYNTTCTETDFVPPITDEQIVPLLFVEPQMNSDLAGTMDLTTMRLTGPCNILSRQRHHDFTAAFGTEPPEVLPVAQYIFAPNDPRGVDLEGNFVNAFQVPPLLSEPAILPEGAGGADYESGVILLRDLCPTIYKLMYSVCGCGHEEMSHLLNWLAFLVQEREKTETAWCFHGVEGTGKGVLLTRVITPILSDEYCVEKNQQDIEEKFNGWMETALLVAVDEFRLADSRDKKLFSKIKSWITERKLSVRNMNSNQMNRNSYSNFWFFSNERDAIRITANDRRINVCPRQEVPLLERFPELETELMPGLASEVATFASFLLDFTYDFQSVRKPIMNAAKEVMKENTEYGHEIFGQCLTSGKLSYFIEFAASDPMTFYTPEAAVAQGYIREAILLIDPETKLAAQQTKYTSRELMHIYNEFSGNTIPTPTKMAKLLKRVGVEQDSKQSRRRKGTPGKSNMPAFFFRVDWSLEDMTTEAIIELQRDFAPESTVVEGGILDDKE